VVILRPDSHGFVHLRISAGTARIVVDQLGGFTKASQVGAVTTTKTGMAYLGSVGTRAVKLAVTGAPTANPVSASQVFLCVTIHAPTKTGELVLTGSREGQVSVVKGVDTTLLLPVTVPTNGVLAHLTAGHATLTVTSVGYIG
jgi:hypothetical protein